MAYLLSSVATQAAGQGWLACLTGSGDQKCCRMWLFCTPTWLSCLAAAAPLPLPPTLSCRLPAGAEHGCLGCLFLVHWETVLPNTAIRAACFWCVGTGCCRIGLLGMPILAELDSSAAAYNCLV